MSSYDLDTSSVIAAQAAEPKEMLSISERDGVTYARINYSSLAILQKCAREGQLSLIRGLKPKLESPALLFGSAIHKGLEVYYCGERTERQIPPRYREIMQMIGCGQWEADWAEYLVFRAARAFVEKALPLSQLPDDNKRSVFTGVWMLQHYFQKYLTDEYVIIHDSEGPVVERKFSFRIYEEPALKIDYFGTIDFVMKSDVSGQILPGDHKTASSLWDFYDKISPNMQYTGYVWAAQKVLGLDTQLFLVNALQVKQPPKTARGSEPDFARQITERTQADFDDLADTVVEEVIRHIKHKRTQFFPMSATGACTAYYGTCKYRDVCAAPKQLKESIIQAKFTETTK